MKIFLVDLQKDLINAWQNQFKNCTDVEVIHGSIFTLEDRCESFANSFAYMDGGIDLAYSDYFGWDLQKRLQKKVFQDFDGELLSVNSSLNDKRNSHGWGRNKIFNFRMICLNIGSLSNYLATRAALRTALKMNLASIAFPGMGTGIGQLKSETCAKQMHEAYQEVILKQTPNYLGVGRQAY